MRPTRRTQPYREHAETRSAGPALAAMLRGRAAHMSNPMDVRRNLYRTSRPLAAALKKRRK